MGSSSTRSFSRPALACASTRLRDAVADDYPWRRFYAEDLGLDAPVDPGGQPLPSFQYPVLSPGEDESVYESCMSLPEGPQSVEGSFSFVPGRLSYPVGKPFEVAVAPFPLEVPEYIF
nr:unnamed protein product [Digitaria exilis]